MHHYQKTTSIIQKELGSAEDYEKLTLEEILQAFSNALNVNNIIYHPGAMKHIIRFISEMQTGDRDYYQSLHYLSQNILNDACETEMFMCPVCEQLYPMTHYNTTDDPYDEFCVDCQEAGAGT